MEVRRVSNAGCFRLHSGQHFLSQALNGENVGLEEVSDGFWNILYYDTLLGRFDERTRPITGAPSLRGELLAMSPDVLVSYVPGCSGLLKIHLGCRTRRCH